MQCRALPTALAACAKSIAPSAARFSVPVVISPAAVWMMVLAAAPVAESVMDPPVGTVVSGASIAIALPDRAMAAPGRVGQRRPRP